MRRALTYLTIAFVLAALIAGAVAWRYQPAPPHVAYCGGNEDVIRWCQK